MEFTVAHIKSDNQFILKKFNGQESEVKMMGLDELTETELQAIIYEDNLYEVDEIKGLLSEQSKFYPIQSSAEIGVNAENFEKLNADQMKPIFKKINANWLLQNNVTLLEELFKVIDHLNALWPNDRTAFFEELWFILKSNLATKDLKIIFNDIEMAKKETEKNKLIKARVEGTKLPHPFTGGDFEDKVMNHYQAEFNENFNIVEFDANKGELVIAGKVKNSPVLVMAKVYDVTRMQKAVLKALFDGLSHNI